MTAKVYPRTHVVWPSPEVRQSYENKAKKDGYSHSKGLVTLAKMYINGEVSLPQAKEVK